jgi:periplasmic protein TonB
MFEDSTFESTGRIRTRSRNWMAAALVVNGSVLAALILIPLIYPEALPHAGPMILMEAPKPPVEQPKPMARPERVVVTPTISLSSTTAPRVIPKDIFTPDRPESLGPINVAAMGDDSGVPGAIDKAFHNSEPKPVVRAAPKGPTPVSSGVMTGKLIDKVTPFYPAMARAARVQGTVVLQAVISKTGTIENLRVESGPALLQQAAIDAVKQWRYQPYLLDGQAVEVETTVSVVFTLGG